jgi:hypothetical protein
MRGTYIRIKIMNVFLSKTQGIFRSSRPNISFSGRTSLHGVSYLALDRQFVLTLKRVFTLTVSVQAFYVRIYRIRGKIVNSFNPSQAASIFTPN